MRLQIEQIGRAPHLPTQVAALITKEIMDGRLKPGDRLPTEHALADMFGVSRNVVREATARLKSDGVIESRQGVGAFISAPERRTALRIEPGSIHNLDGVHDLFELRGLLEIDAAGLAATRHTDADIETIRAAVDQLRAAADNGEQQIDADLVFHRAIAKASANAYVHTFVTYLSRQVRETIRATQDIFGAERDENLGAITLGEHIEICDAIASRDPKAARDAMRRHIKGATDRLVKKK